MNTEQFIREVAKKSGFAIKDVKEILSVMVEVFEEAVLERKNIVIRGLGSLVYTNMSEFVNNNFLGQGRKKVPGSIKLQFRLSKKLRNLVKK